MSRSMQFSRTFSCRFFRMGVSRGSRSLIGGVIFVMPITLTIACARQEGSPVSTVRNFGH